MPMHTRGGSHVDSGAINSGSRCTPREAGTSRSCRSPALLATATTILSICCRPCVTCIWSVRAGCKQRRGVWSDHLLYRHRSHLQPATMSGSFTYKKLEIESARWYWNKQPLNLKGVLPWPFRWCTVADASDSHQTVCTLSCSCSSTGRAVSVTARALL